jgi:hypothetical protein
MHDSKLSRQINVLKPARSISHVNVELRIKVSEILEISIISVDTEWRRYLERLFLPQQ